MSRFGKAKPKRLKLPPKPIEEREVEDEDEIEEGDQTVQPNPKSNPVSKPPTGEIQLEEEDEVTYEVEIEEKDQPAEREQKQPGSVRKRKLGKMVGMEEALPRRK